MQRMLLFYWRGRVVYNTSWQFDIVQLINVYGIAEFRTFSILIEGPRQEIRRGKEGWDSHSDHLPVVEASFVLDPSSNIHPTHHPQSSKMQL